MSAETVISTSGEVLLAGLRVEILAPGSVVVVGLTFIAGVAATVLQLRYADNTQ